MKKINPEKAKSPKAKCNLIMDLANERLHEAAYNLMCDSTTIDQLDIGIEHLLTEYYAYGNNIIDFYGLGDGFIEDDD